MQHVDVSERVHFLLKKAKLKNEFGVEVGGIGGVDGGVQVLGWFLSTHPTRHNKTISRTLCLEMIIKNQTWD